MRGPACLPVLTARNKAGCWQRQSLAAVALADGRAAGGLLMHAPRAFTPARAAHSTPPTQPCLAPHPQVLGSIGEQFDDGEEICGIVVNVRPKQDRISVWTKTAANEALQVGGQSRVHPPAPPQPALYTQGGSS